VCVHLIAQLELEHLTELYGMFDRNTRAVNWGTTCCLLLAQMGETTFVRSHLNVLDSIFDLLSLHILSSQAQQQQQTQQTSTADTARQLLYFKYWHCTAAAIIKQTLSHSLTHSLAGCGSAAMIN